MAKMHISGSFPPKNRGKLKEKMMGGKHTGQKETEEEDK
jgi:hypothetical protein